MKDQQTQNRFIELRAQGWSLQRIAGELHVAKRTLVDWNRRAEHEIADLQQIEREALLERILVSHEEELARLTAHLNRIESILARRNLECLSTESLFVMAAAVRAQLRRLTAAPARTVHSGVPPEVGQAAGNALESSDSTTAVMQGGAA